MNKFAIIIQGPSSYLSRQLEAWSYYSDSLIFSTWEGYEHLYKNEKVIFNPIPDNCGVVNLNLQVISTQSGLKEAERLGYKYAIKMRSDFIPTNAKMFLERLDESITVFLWHLHQEGYYTDYFMSGPIHDLTEIWSFDGTIRCSYPEEAITKSLKNLGKPINQYKKHINDFNDFHQLKWGGTLYHTFKDSPSFIDQ